ncbi:protein arginine N-methyltransferase 6 isoform X2 [Periplaneta americana]
MLKDSARIRAYKDAVFLCQEYFRNKVVMDVGAGTGILSVFCAQAGASTVYAVEASNLADMIPKVAEENDFASVIKVLKQKVEDVKLPNDEKVDVIVSEWMGFYLLHEGMLDSVLHARDIHLKAGGKLFPEEAKLWCAPCSLPALYDFWDNVEGVRMHTVGQEWRRQKSQEPQILDVPSSDILADPSKVCSFDLYTCTARDLDSISKRFVLPANREGQYQGLCVWFSCVFPSFDDEDPVVLNTASNAESTHWKQTVVMLPNEQEVEEGTPMAWELKLERSGGNCRHYNIEFTELDPECVQHPVPCMCYMTKCIVMRACLEQSGAWPDGEIGDGDNNDTDADLVS